MQSILSLLLVLMAGTSDESSAAPTKAASPFPLGEKLVYVGHVDKAGISFNVGKCTFTVTRDSDGATQLSAVAKGQKFGYVLDTRIESRIPEGAERPNVFELSQRGSEVRDKRLVLGEKGAVYWKVKHCKKEKCRSPDHMVERVDWHGPIPWGTENVHCTKNGCDIPKHQVWRVRRRHTYESPHLDMLTAIYHARRLELKVGGDPVTVPVVNDHDRWNVAVRAVEEGKVEVAAGTFDATKIVLEPSPEEGTEEKAEFRGIFGMHGAITIWVEKESQRPILVQGKLPFGFMDLNARVELVEIDAVPVDGKVESGRGRR